MKKIAISCGDLNGVGLEILLKSHFLISQHIQPLYCVHFELLSQASKLLSLPMPPNLFPHHCIPPSLSMPKLQKGQITKESGKYSFESFVLGCELCECKKADALCTLPIHKKAWNLAKIPYLGHTQALSDRYNQEAIMMLGWEKMFVALYTDHLPLSAVSKEIKESKLYNFFLQLDQSFKQEKYCVMGVNPHCGDGGIIGREDEEIKKAILKINAFLGKEVFLGPIPSDAAFIPARREEFNLWISMYHDVGLAPLKALYFHESINISLGLPILRTSVDHGVAFDIAFEGKAEIQSYLNAIEFAKNFAKSSLPHKKELILDEIAPHRDENPDALIP